MISHMLAVVESRLRVGSVGSGCWSSGWALARAEHHAMAKATADGWQAAGAGPQGPGAQGERDAEVKQSLTHRHRREKERPP
jgi:hypothetical protein